MENIFLINDVEAIDSFNKQSPTPEDCKNVGEPNPEFLSKVFQATRSTLNDDEPITESISSTLYVSPDEEEYEKEEEEENQIDRYDIELPEGYQEIELYDNQKTFDENFKNGDDIKYILLSIDKNRSKGVANSISVIPTPQSRCIIDIEKVEDYSSLEFIPVDYETLFGFVCLQTNLDTCIQKLS